MRRSDVTADILNYLSDGNVHSLQEIACAVECSYKTAQRHVASLSYRYPIETVFGRDKQGMRLDVSYSCGGKVLSNDKLQIIVRALEFLQDSDCEDVDRKLLAETIKELSVPSTKKEAEGREI